MLSGDNGILQKATEAKIYSERASIVEQAQTDVLGYQSENKGEALEESQLKTILEKYFINSEIPEELPNDLSTLELTTQSGNYKIKVSEIYNGNIKNNNVQTTISFNIKVKDNDRDKGTFNFTCVEGETWYQWASSSSEPLYVNTTYETCGYFNGSLQELILSDSNQEHGISDSSSYCQLARNDRGTWELAKRGDEIVENITYILDFYED